MVYMGERQAPLLPMARLLLKHPTSQLVMLLQVVVATAGIHSMVVLPVDFQISQLWAEVSGRQVVMIKMVVVVSHDHR